MRFSAVVMAGGRSRRMGRDKASLPAPPHRTLLERQLAVLSATAPCELLVAAREGQALPSTTFLRSGQVVRDDGLAGPLGGLVCVLRAMRSPRALVVAVDAVGINPWILRRLLGAASPDEEHVGVIARTVAAPQPLVALWPRAMLSRAEAQLGTARDYSLRTLVAQGIADGLLRWLDVPPWDEPRFANWNCRSEVRATARWA